MPVARWIRRLALAGVLLCFAVVVLGAYVRLNAAGLGCPDWPGCYGHVTPLGAENNAAAQAAFPNRPLDTGKAWKEMVHRYAAGTLVLIVVGITALAIADRRRKFVGIPYMVALLSTIVVQAALGMLTVTWQLKPLIVTLHLIFGMTTLGLLWWLWLSLPTHSWGGMTVHAGGNASSGGSTAAAMRTAYAFALIGLIALALQITLGGWTSSNYAAVACPDFPRCQNAWWPHTDYRNAFVLWRGLGINYEGGVLDNPARVAIHLTHRIGAVVATLALAFAALLVAFQKSLPRALPAAYAVLGALALQLTIGISMVLKTFPLRLTTAHTAGAALLLLATITLVRRLSPR
ncbi:MAG TPA: COX15/CtaA family protein [Steroidobacteraceae bacterium]|nr:COX15/CtaA family protein [Steroidobacteraceae bacterium]